MSENYTVQDVFNNFYSGYGKTHELSAAQRKAAYHIMNCKTGAFGANVSVCEDCGCICILHTWGSAMNFHPHIHAIVLGGGLDS